MIERICSHLPAKQIKRFRNVAARCAHATLLFTLGLLFSCQSPEKTEDTWYRGNLHTHSYWSDGDEFPEMIMDWYKAQGYHFVGLSDHNILAAGEKWTLVTRSRMYEEGFVKYLEKFGPDWVVYQADSGRTRVKLKTISEYRPLFEDDRFLIIQSEEITDKFGDKPVHVNATNIQELIKPSGGESVTAVMQNAVDAVLKQRSETGVPMFPHINHPNFHFAISVQDMIDLRGERFFEVYNGHPEVYNYGDSLHMGTEEMWDRINIAYHQRGQPLLYGLATDDSHHYHQFGSSFSNAGRGWVMVRSDSLSAGSLIQAMESGEFYASTGVILADIAYSENVLSISVREEPGVSYVIEFIGATTDQANSQVLNRVEGLHGDFNVEENYLFVSARVTSTKEKQNPFAEGEGDFEMAWTQPVARAE